MKSAESTPATLEWPAARTASAQPALSGRALRLSLRPRRVAPMTLLVVVMVAGWWYLAPPQLGGATCACDGRRNQHAAGYPPLRHRRAAPGQPVPRRRRGRLPEPVPHRVVLHRIVAIHNGHYTFKGDNNGFLDSDHPTRAQLVGKRRFQIPSLGRLVGIVHTPPVLAALAALLVLLGWTRRPPPAGQRPAVNTHAATRRPRLPGASR